METSSQSDHVRPRAPSSSRLCPSREVAMSEQEGEQLKSTMSLSKAVSLIKNKHSCEMVERHVRALNRIAINNKNGFLLKDLGELCQLLAVCGDRLHRFPEYEEPLCRIVELCSLPFLKEKALDESTYAPNVIDTLALLGHLAKVPCESLRLQVVRAVATFYSEEPDRAHLEGLQVTRLSFNAALVERSGVARTLVEVLQLAKEPQTLLATLHALQLLSDTATNCNQMLMARAAQQLCEVLTLPDPSHQILFVCIEILWNFLEYGSQMQVAEQLSSLECISTLRHVFHELMVDGSGSLQTKQLRNDVLTICSLVAQQCPDAAFMESGFLRDLCMFATLSERSSGTGHPSSDPLRYLRLGRGHEDFELKKALLCILTSLSGDPAAVKVMSGQKVLRSLLAFVVQNDKAGEEWNLAQFEELQLLALSCLSALAPLCLEDYMTCQGNTRILLLIEWCIRDDGSFKGHGNSFHGDGGRGNRVSQLRYCLRLLLSMCSVRDEVLLQDLHEQGAVPMLVGLLQQFLEPGIAVGGSTSNPEEDPILLEMQADALLTTSCLCELDIHRKELFGGYDGVQLLVQYLKRDSAQFSSGRGHNRLLLAATDCVWCTVVGSPMVEDIFLENEGVFVMLDLLKLCPKTMRNLVLGVLVDICENPKAVSHLAAWRGSGESTTWSLLAQLWREEEAEMGVPRGRVNTLAGSFQPLVGVEQNTSGMPPLPSHCPSAAVTDITDNTRAKIFALCSKMGFQFPSDELSTEDKITLCIIEGYLDLKAGEVWSEVAGELAQEGLRPVTPDRESLQEVLHTHEEKAEETLKIQHELLEEQCKNDDEEELQFYEKLRRSHLMEDTAKREFAEFVQRTSHHKVLQEAKKHQLVAIDSSRTSNVAIGDRFHSVDHHNLNITNFCGRHLSIATTPMKLLAGNDASPQPHKEPATVPQ